eukprot:TRINITY_DN29702_c0_g1_i11.p1 TRINITY_DN29702_c0_g1~~TRINITY_DN29702_c0_g1_i11.p1  ORF type:complete len:129 (+),score=21.13 TRINITY_DN29702_c0_g1_i11:84-470(+)
MGSNFQYMLRTIHADVSGWRRLVVVNNAFHLPRTKVIFEKVFSLPPVPFAAGYDLSFVEVPDDGLEGEVLASRVERERTSTAGFIKNTQAFATLRDMHRFLFVDHLAYSSKRLLKDREPIDPKALSTY